MIPHFKSSGKEIKICLEVVGRGRSWRIRMRSQPIYFFMVDSGLVQTPGLLGTE
jgi:hypothetical protein